MIGLKVVYGMLWGVWDVGGGDVSDVYPSLACRIPTTLL